MIYLFILPTFTTNGLPFGPERFDSWRQSVSVRGDRLSPRQRGSSGRVLVSSRRDFCRDFAVVYTGLEQLAIIYH